ncbi:MAG: pimeloyl-[acyl-carrier protein] methyl ester esterase [Gammaproteobacteria bacterium]|nr:MAG: pimeloyl-[acyl-carrier protein] methyl ester esterase [Gammaproteobacteria bacterium]
MSGLTLYYDTYQSTSKHANPPEMILIHGWGLHSLVWDDVMPGLLENFQVTVVDLPGLGRSPMPGGEYDLDYLVEHVLNIAPQTAVWVGWSLGGLVAMQVAAKFPERVSGLITVASSPKFTASDRWPAAINPDVLQGFMDIFAEDWEGTLIRFLALQCKGAATMKNDVRFLKEILYFHGLPAQKALRCGLQILKDADLTKTIGAVQCPSLHVFGELDHIVPVGVSQAVKSLQPACETSIIKDVSHVPFISTPDLFLAAVNDFLAANGFLQEEQIVG